MGQGRPGIAVTAPRDVAHARKVDVRGRNQLMRARQVSQGPLAHGACEHLVVVEGDRNGGMGQLDLRSVNEVTDHK